MNAEQINALSTQLNNTSSELVRLHEEIDRLRKENEELKTKLKSTVSQKDEFECGNCGYKFACMEDWEGACDEHSCHYCECECEDCQEDEETDKEDVGGELECRRCEAQTAWSYVFEGGDCLNYCGDCLAEMEDKKYIVKCDGETQYRFIEAQ